jgi:hypothetical protein
MKQPLELHVTQALTTQDEATSHIHVPLEAQ